MSGLEGNCEVHNPHDELCDRIAEKLPEESQIARAAELFKVFGDPTRLKILTLLSISECCVCDIAKLIDLSQSAVSHQLRILRQTRLVKYRKQGKEAFYSLDDEHVREILSLGFEHAGEEQGGGR